MNLHTAGHTFPITKEGSGRSTCAHLIWFACAAGRARLKSGPFLFSDTKRMFAQLEVENVFGVKYRAHVYGDRTGGGARPLGFELPH